MKEEIWRNFPEDLYELVLAKLPFVALFRFRLVCKNWNLLLTDKMKMGFPDPRYAHQPYFYTIYTTHEICEFFISLYDPCSNRWYHPTFPCLPLDKLIVGSALGLVCMGQKADGDLYICNPIYRSFKVLPPLECERPCHGDDIAMVPDKTVGAEDGYIIMCICRIFLSFYISRDNSWTRKIIIPRGAIRNSIMFHDESHAVYMNGTLYFTTIKKPNVIVSCHVATGVWKQTRVPLPMMNLARHEITAHRGKLMMIGLERRLESTPPFCATSQVWIWELEKKARTPFWKEVDRMPETVDIDFRTDLRRYGYVKYWLMNCHVGNIGDLIMWTLNPGRKNKRFVMYNFKTSEWRLDVANLVLQPNRQMAWGLAFHSSRVSFKNLIEGDTV